LCYIRIVMIILDGKVARDAHTDKLKKDIKNIGFSPTLAIIQVGDNPDSTLYIEQKKKFALKIGVTVQHVLLPESATFGELEDEIGKLNINNSISGIIVQLPLPKHLDREDVIGLIDPKKDVDGLTDENQKLLTESKPRFIPATARGILSLLDFYKIDIEGKNIAVLGRSRLVGSPTALALLHRGGNVSVCHSKTTNTREITKGADIVVVAIGKPEFIDASYIKDGAVVVDVGINTVLGPLDDEIPQRKVVGDVLFFEVAKVAGALSPVPGGVGPMTVLSLFENLLDASKTA